MTAQRGHFAGQHPGQPPGPILRVGHDGPDLGKILREGAGLPEKLRPPIEAVGQARRQCLRKGRAHPVIGFLGCVGRVAFVVENRQHQAGFTEQRAGRAMGGDGNAMDSMRGVQALQTARNEEPQIFDIGMGIGRLAPHQVGGAFAGKLPAAGAVDQHHFGIGLADVDDGDVARKRMRHVRARSGPGRDLADFGTMRQN